MAALDSLFPDTPRVFYRKAPLVQVTGQVRFPHILRIEKDVPAEFQELIRHAFPIFERVNPFMQQLPPEMLQAMGPNVIQAAYHFLTEDRKSTIELTPLSVGLTTQSYTVWEKFHDELSFAISALVKVYQPIFFSRVGLRYQDLIDRTKLQLGNEPWSQLLQPQILGELAIQSFEDNAQAVSRVLQIKMPSGAGTMVLRHGFGATQQRGEVGYVIDLDFSTEQKTEVIDVRPVLSRLHGEVGRAFRWCIAPKLHDALGPSELDPAKFDISDRDQRSR